LFAIIISHQLYYFKGAKRAGLSYYFSRLFACSALSGVARGAMAVRVLPPKGSRIRQPTTTALAAHALSLLSGLFISCRYLKMIVINNPNYQFLYGRKIFRPIIKYNTTKIQITNYQSPITNHQLQITNYQSPITNHNSHL
jgi:hypothetical protein